MKTLPAELEALMPEPFGKIVNKYGDPHAFAERGVRFLGDIQKQAIGTALFTADQMREAIRGATERAAKIVESGAPPRKLEGGRIEVGERARNAFAAAIRSGGEAGS